jgi:hypothetical protein
MKVVPFAVRPVKLQMGRFISSLDSCGFVDVGHSL